MIYTVHVELHNAGPDDYETLNDAMVYQGFSKTLNGNDGTVYRLPLSEFGYAGPSRINEVLASAQIAAGKTHKRYKILVSQASAILWDGLEEEFRMPVFG